MRGTLEILERHKHRFVPEDLNQRIPSRLILLSVPPEFHRARVVLDGVVNAARP